LALLVSGLLALSACGARPVPTPPAALPVGVTWQWVGLNQAQSADQPVIQEPEKFLLLFNNDFTYAVKADCNTGLGQYSASGSSLTIHPVPITPADCGPESLYRQYAQLLANVGSFATEGDQLVLILKNDGGRMTFARSAASLGAGGTQGVQIVGVPWQWIDIGGAQAFTPEPGKYTLTLKQDGTYEAKADCNNSSGTYTIEGDRLTLVAGPTTLATCGPNSLSEQYLSLLSNVATFSSSAGRLMLTLKADLGTMVFARL
jgi:heat shock protein HslJ